MPSPPLRPADRCLPGMHENAEGHGHVQGRFAPARGMLTRPRWLSASCSASGLRPSSSEPTSTTPALREAERVHRRAPQLQGKDVAQARATRSRPHVSHGIASAAPREVRCARGWVGSGVRGESKMRCAPNASAVRKMRPDVERGADVFQVDGEGKGPEAGPVQEPGLRAHQVPLGRLGVQRGQQRMAERVDPPQEHGPHLRLPRAQPQGFPPRPLRPSGYGIASSDTQELAKVSGIRGMRRPPRPPRCPGGSARPSASGSGGKLAELGKGEHRLRTRT